MPLRASTLVVASEAELLAHLKERLRYDQRRGLLFRKPGFRGVVAGARVGCPESSGKLQVTFLGVRHQVDRLIWLLETGSLPNDALLHIDGNPRNDRFSNLREGRKSDDLTAHASRFFARAQERFGEELDFTGAKYNGADAKLSFACVKHGRVQRSPADILASTHGCPLCCRVAGAGARASAAKKTPEQKRATRVAYVAAHPEMYAGASQRSRERMKRDDPARFQANEELARRRSKVWMKTPKGRVSSRTQRQRRRARLAGAPGAGLTRVGWVAICESQTNELGQVCCAYCKRVCNPTIDHLVPLARGGRHEPSNIIAACGPCNSSKCDRLITEWERARQLLSEAELVRLSGLTLELLKAA